MILITNSFHSLKYNHACTRYSRCSQFVSMPWFKILWMTINNEFLATAVLEPGTSAKVWRLYLLGHPAHQFVLEYESSKNKNDSIELRRDIIPLWLLFSLLCFAHSENGIWGKLNSSCSKKVPLELNASSSYLCSSFVFI